jgi:hypothetical protein
MTAGLGSTGSRSGDASGPASGNALTWVRRRRWVRVMRRRLDISPLPFLQPDGVMYRLLEDGCLVPVTLGFGSDFDEDGVQEPFLPTRSPLGTVQDYVARARYLAGSQAESPRDGSGQSSPTSAWRAIAKLERATTELRQGMLSGFHVSDKLWLRLIIASSDDSDHERKTQAEVLLNAYSRDLDRRRLAAGTLGLRIPNDCKP